MPKERVAILGGGVGALATAYALTRVPNWQDRYDITIYQNGWRLGGKGASSRRHFNGAWRIEEHGPHIWFGFYFNAFRVIAEAYDYCSQHNLTPGSPFQSWSDAFHAKRDGTFMEYVGGCWKQWVVSLSDRPGNPLQPGDPHPWTHVVDALGLLLGWFEDLEELTPAATPAKGSRPLAHWLDRGFAWLAARRGQPLPPAQRQDTLLHKAHRLARAPQLDPRARPSGIASWFYRLGAWLMKFLLGQFRKRIYQDIKHLLEEHDEIRHLWEMLDLGVTAIYGLLADDVLFKGFNAIENIDYSHWLQKHGSYEYWSAPVHGIYDSGAHYEKGKAAPPDRPNERPASANLAAGTAVSALLRMFAGYSGAFSYKMQAGMGETVFTPLYLALADLGVKFVFFHRTTNLVLSAEGAEVAAIEMDVQATVKGGPGAYQPLLDPIGGLRCWPVEPLYDQLEEGDKLKGVDFESWPAAGAPAKTRVLRLGEDFDKVVLGISVAALRPITASLERNARWKQMLDGVQTVQTQFFQLWAARTSEQLCGSTGQPLAEAFVEPYSTWLDMSQVRLRECWPPSAGVESVHYFVGPLEESEGPLPPASEEAARVKQQALNFLRSSLVSLWPSAVSPSGKKEFDWNVLAAPPGAQGEARFDSQYWRANVQPTERYVLSTVNSKFCRLRSDDSGFANLYLAGDWTLNGLDAGSVEAAVMSGIQAAQGVSDYPLEILGGYDEMGPRHAPPTVATASATPMWAGERAS